MELLRNFSGYYCRRSVDMNPSGLETPIFALSFFSFMLSLYLLFVDRRKLLDEVKDLLNKQYSKQYIETFPKIRIKTKSIELEGKVCDIFDDNLIILDYYGTKKAVEWNSITFMEFKKYTPN